MRILLLVHSFNSLSQRLYVELAQDGHELSVELDIHERVTSEAVELWNPDLILAPFLKRAIPPSLWQRHLCLIVHPGPPGDRGPSALDWAILRGETVWGVTVLQAQAELDAGPVWGSAAFALRAARKSSLYRNEVTEGAVCAVRAALARVARGTGPLLGAGSTNGHGWQPLLRQADRSDRLAARRYRGGAAQDPFGRRVSRAWKTPSPAIASACSMRTPRCGSRASRGPSSGAATTRVCRATSDAAIWIGQLQPADGARPSFKRPAVLALGDAADSLPRYEDEAADAAGAQASAAGEIRYEECGAVAYLHFDFYNGAVSTAQCERMRAAYARACRRPTRVIVLMGGSDFWCNGMHLHCIEAADSPADASWANINGIDDLACDILHTDTHLIVAALQRQCGRRRGLPGARRRPRPGSQRHRAEPALSQYGQFVRFGILDVSAAEARGRGPARGISWLAACRSAAPKRARSG